MRFQTATFCIVLFLSIPIISEGQNTALLDQKFGYKEFVFGSPRSKFGSNLKFFFEPNEGYRGYEYVGIDHKSFLGMEWSSFKLAFYNGRLISLEFYFDTHTQTLQNLCQDLSILFGEPELGQLHDELGDRIFNHFFAWRGEKVGLDLTQYSSTFFSEDLREVTVVKIMPLDANLIMLSDDF